MSVLRDLLVVGAGPAGMAAAVEAADLGLSVTVADEGSGPGGQIHRGILGGPLAEGGVLGADYEAGRELAERFLASPVERLCRATAFMIERRDDGFAVAVSIAGAARLIRARRVLIAVGALERPFPIPGWTLPGVMTAGAAQTMLKASALAPDGPIVLAGSGPLLLLLAAQYARLGVRVEAILDTTPPGGWRRALRHLPGFAASPYLLKGLSLLLAARSSTRIVTGVTALAAEGEERLSAVRFTAKGRDQRTEARTLLLHQGVAPQINLALATGAAHDWSDERLAFEPRLSADGESTVPGLFIAGDAGGIAGAGAAVPAGRLSARAIARSLGIAAPENAAIRRDLALARRGRRFLDAWFRPAEAFRIPADAVVACRCEGVTAGEIRALARAGAQGPNQAKALCRAGMGPCQGRLCGLTVTEIMAETTGRPPAEIGHYRLRPPVKPVTLAELAGLAEDGS
jgi:NADPH-dependent 2,4-dienoyl-CoA reductase/sulfur reductase-like enzyme